jgi:type II secretory pathway component HofQ
VNLADADLPNALRLLAEAGGFGLVVESDVSGTVSTRLDEVDPYDALITLAGANGAEARYERGIVIVRRKGP